MGAILSPKEQSQEDSQCSDMKSTDQQVAVRPYDSTEILHPGDYLQQ